ncbi:hypothetical protein CC80DRAFT_225748 [Byssothecium circinans]|uniref:Uncharacterized protein n=1 Tax=Byssothecium circinans TaxID=147558 RepID=A0A6A5TES1_9PLEO|nr:hypothetical protein CC80DRAFT_225748 [Byssothecium circinans]
MCVYEVSSMCCFHGQRPPLTLPSFPSCTIRGANNHHSAPRPRYYQHHHHWMTSRHLRPPQRRKRATCGVGERGGQR